MIYNEYAQMLESTNPATGACTADDLSVMTGTTKGRPCSRTPSGPTAPTRNAGYADITTRFVAASLEGWMHCRETQRSG
ncbi:MAG: hypothetical protein Ct9H300mP31_06370 [Acidimicrobiaceae bacterium]|nr:MAG: hypothetical protein Ct9H300mP31_06370 [Acidimicrobiaceae bacterium]